MKSEPVNPVGDAPAAGPAFGVLNSPRKAALLARDIKLSHSVFALPFALLATFLSSASVQQRLPGAWTLALIVACMVLARTMAMAVNRWADARFDALNPRTAKRAVPSGGLSRGEVLGAAAACALLFVVAALGFFLLDGNVWPAVLAPLVLAWLAGYSFTKRFTWLCHLWLGSALALSPLAASIAVAPAYLATPEPYLLAGMVMCWVAGFDLIYALQDVEIDRAAGLYSMPSRLGVEPSLWVARALHAAALAALTALLWVSPVLDTAFAVGVVLVAGLLVLEHALVWRSQERRIDVAFLTVNGVISLLLGVAGVVDVVRAVH